MASTKDRKKTRGAKKVRKATKKQRRNKISKSGKPKGEESETAPFRFLRTLSVAPGQPSSRGISPISSSDYQRRF
jgi:hypothetical protein